MTKNISSLHLDILNKARQEALKKLLPLAKDFVLGGGTALALQISHRMSYDFDFFSKKALAKNLLKTISQVISIGNVSVDSHEELTIFTKDNVKVTFLYYPFKDMYAIEEFENGLKLFSVKDIAIKKAYTIGRRGEYRDYFDLYSILKDSYIDFPQLISDAKDIYGTIFEEKIFLQQLVYFDDLLNFDIIPIPNHVIPPPDEVKKFFEKLVKEHIN